MKKLKIPKNNVLPNTNGQTEIAVELDQTTPVSLAVVVTIANPDDKLSHFLLRQKGKLLELLDGVLDTVTSVSRDTLRAPAEGSEASVFGMHQGDAGSDAYDRDFAVSLLTQEQDALYEIEEALKRMDAGTYGICEVSGKPIAHVRLQAIPFARCTVECQSQIEKQNKTRRLRQPVVSIFGLSDEDGGEAEEEQSAEFKD